MENIEENNLEKKVRELELNNYILEEENSLLRENVQCLLSDIQRLGDIKKEEKKLQEEKIEIEKMKSGKIYKILSKLKKIIK